MGRRIAASTQRDTYFAVAKGGLKLREEQPGRPHLVQFERASEPQQRESRYRIIEVGDGEALRAALAATIGIRGVVVKRRHLLLWQNVRIHLDEVEQLGTFIELEAVAPPDSDLAHEHRLVANTGEKPRKHWPYRELVCPCSRLFGGLEGCKGDARGGERDANGMQGVLGK